MHYGKSSKKRHVGSATEPSANPVFTGFRTITLRSLHDDEWTVLELNNKMVWSSHEHVYHFYFLVKVSLSFC